MSILSKIVIIAAVAIVYSAIGVFLACFANDSGKLSNFKFVFVAVLWLPLMILTVLGLSGPLDRFIFGKDE